MLRDILPNFDCEQMWFMSSIESRIALIFTPITESYFVLIERLEFRHRDQECLDVYLLVRCLFRGIVFRFVLVSWGGVRLCPLGTSATISHIVAPSDDGWCWVWNNWWNDWQGKPEYSEETCPGAALSTNLIWPDPDLNSGHRGGNPATNC
jgi:hypothetical protein